MDLVRGATDAGRSIRRPRVVTVPHGDYTRWGLTVAPHNISAGEDIRWLPRHLIDPAELTTDDYWQFDDKRAVFTVFKPDGQFVGGAAITDPTIVARCDKFTSTGRRTINSAGHSVQEATMLGMVQLATRPVLA